jgi:methyltransferase family protein
MNSFDQSLNQLDIALFSKIESQTSHNDRRSLLAVQSVVRKMAPGYTYLEIGSYLGGSLQPHLLDPQCARIYSIDKRPIRQPDERGVTYIYKNNSTQRMIDNLRSVHEPGLSKLTCIDASSQEIDPAKIESKPRLCFIDGLHLDEAVSRDFLFCMKILSSNGAIVFHDAQITYNALSDVVNHLRENHVPFRAYNLPDTLFLIEVNTFPIHMDPVIREMLTDNYAGYLASLRANDGYRRFATMPVFNLLRGLKARITRTRIKS